MTKEQFMTELEQNLQGISYEERKEALRYYEEYFDEAGADENAADQLESPEDIAKAIKEDLDIKLQMVKSSIETHEDKMDKMQDETKDTASSYEYVETKNDTAKIVLIVIVCVIFSPGILGVFFGAIGVAIGLLATVFALSIAAGAIAIAGVVLFAAGIATLFESVLIGLAMMGSGLIVCGIGILILVFAIWFWGTAVPAFIKWISKLCHKEKQGVAA